MFFQRKKKRNSGQVLAEYAMMLAMFAGIAIVLLFLLSVLSDYGWRAISLVVWEPM